MRAVPAISLAVLALLPATASAATVTVTGDDGNPLRINATTATGVRQLDQGYTVTPDATDRAYYKTTVVGPDGGVASTGSSCYPKSVIPNVSRYFEYRGNGNYAVLVQSYSDEDCTAGLKQTRYLFAINAGTAITAPTGVLMTRQKNSFATIDHELPVALNPGIAYEFKYAKDGVIGADGGISGPSTDSFVDRTTGLADLRFQVPGHYVAVVRIKSGDYYTPWSPAVNLTVKAPFDISSVFYPDSHGPSYKLRASMQDPYAHGKRVTVYYAKGRKGGRYHKLGRSSKINSTGRFTLRFRLRHTGVYRLQYRFKGSSLVRKGKVTDGIKITRGFL